MEAEPSSKPSSWLLFPGEQVLWSGGREAGVPYPRRWFFLPLAGLALAIVSGSFAGLLAIESMPGEHKMIALACTFAALSIVSVFAPHVLLDHCHYAITNQRILWSRGRIKRAMDRSGITYARIAWHPHAPLVGHVEVVRAVPFGPLARRQRIVFHDVRDPVVVLSLMRGAVLAAHANDRDVSFAERLDQDETVVWGSHPAGLQLGWREVSTSIAGLGVSTIGLQYGLMGAKLLLGLEGLGLQVKTWEWMLLFVAMLTTWLLIQFVGLGLIWYGLFRSRTLGKDTEYLLTDRRVLIRRGRTELSLNRTRIVDTAQRKTLFGHHHLFLLLDAPNSKALADSGALGTLLPSRNVVPPVFFDLRDLRDIEPWLHKLS